MLIIAGYLEVDTDVRDEYVATCAEVVRQARASSGCLDFAMTADTLAPGRVNVFERWETEEQLMAFRGSGPDDAQAGQVRNAEIVRYGVSTIGPP